MTKPTTTLHFGLDNSAKARQLIDSIRDSPGRTKSDFLFLTPNRQRSLELIRLLDPALEASFELPVLTIRELVDSLCRQRNPTLRILSEFEKRSLLLVLESDSGRGASPGRIAELSRLLSVIKSQNITDPELLRLQLTRSKTALDSAEIETLAIFESYQEELASQGWEDWDGCYCQVHDGLVTGQSSVVRLFPAVTRLSIELPIRLTPIETSIVSLLTADARESHLLVPLADPKAVSALDGWSFLEKIPAETRIHKTGPSRPILISHSSLQGELGWTVDQIQECLSESESEVRIGIASASIEHSTELERLLEARGVKTLWESRPPPRISRLAESLVQYLQLLESSFERLRVFDFLAGSRIRSPFSRRQLLSLEELATRAGIGRGFEQWQSRLEAAEAVLGQELQLPEGSARQLLALLEDLSLDLCQRLNFRDWYAGCAGKLQPLLDFSLLDGGEGGSLNDFRQAVRLQTEVCGRRTISFFEFKSLCRQSLERPTTVPFQSSSPGVRIGSPEEFQNCEFTHLFWIGLTEETYPKVSAEPLAESETPLPFRTSNRQERFDDACLVFQNLVRGADRVTLSFHERHHERETAPSSLLAEIEVTTLHSQDWTALSSPCSGENIARGRRIQAIRESLRPSVYTGFLSAPEAQDEVRRILGQDEGSIRVSPSLLERYAACGFRFFARSVLGIQPGSSSSSGPTAAELGELIHRILYRFRRSGYVDPAKFQPEEEPTWIRTQGDRIKAIAEKEISRRRSQLRWGEGLFWECPTRQLIAGLGEGKQSSGLLAEFLRFEWQWGRWNRSVAAEVRVGPIPVGEVKDWANRALPVSLEGRLDRVDRNPTGLVVIDYKTGNDVRKRCYDGWGFQLPLYLALAQEVWQEPASDAFFLALRFPLEIQTERLRMPRDGRSELWGKLAEYYRGRMLELTQQLQRGFFPPTLLRPDQVGCRSCELREVCRYEGAQASHLRRSRQIFQPVRLLQAGHWTGIFDENED